MKLSREGRVAGLVALALLASGNGCGGGGGGSAGCVGDECFPTVERDFEFTVTVPGVTSNIGGVEFFRDSGLTQRGVNIESSSGAKVGEASIIQGSIDPDFISAMPAGFKLAVHFDASGSMVDQDPSDLRFTAATNLVTGVQQVASGTQVRYFTFRHNPNDPRDDAYDTVRFKPVGDVGAASAEEERGNSPAASATYNIIGDGGGANGSLTGNNWAMLLLTDGENNSEDGTLMPGCTGPEGRGGPNCAIPSALLTRADSRDVRIYVAGLGNNDDALAKFRGLAVNTDGAYTKATQSSDLDRQFTNLGRLMVRGGVVVGAKTNVIRIRETGEPFVRGWMKFNRPSGGCGDAEAVGSDACKIEF